MGLPPVPLRIDHIIPTAPCEENSAEVYTQLFPSQGLGEMGLKPAICGSRVLVSAGPGWAASGYKLSLIFSLCFLEGMVWMRKMECGGTEAVPCEGVCRDLTKQPHTLQLGFAASRRRKGWREIPNAVVGDGALLIHRRSRNSGFSQLRKVGVVESGASHLPTCFLLMVGCYPRFSAGLGLLKQLYSPMQDR